MKHTDAKLARDIIIAVTLAVCYFATAKLGLAFAIPPGHASAIWPPSGIALAALLILGYRFWPGIWIGSVLVNLTTGVSLVTATAFATGNCAEALAAAWLFQRLMAKPPFQGLEDALRFVAIAAVSAIVAASMGAGSMLLAERIDWSQFGWNWSTWWLGDLAGQVILTPLLLALAGLAGDRRTTLNRSRLGELSLLFSIQLALSLFVFGGWLPDSLAENLLYLPMILLIWVCLHFSLAEITASSLLFAAAAIWGTSRGVGAFGTQASGESFFQLQILLNTYAVTGLVVASIVAGRRSAEAASTQSQLELARETKTRGRLEKWFQQLLVASPDALIVSNDEGVILLVNQAAERLFGYSSDEMIGQAIEILIPAKNRGKHRQHRETYAHKPFVRTMGTGMELTACRKQGTEFPAEIALGPVQTEDGLVVFSSVRDTSARKAAEQALRDSEERFYLAVRGTDAGIWDWDLRTDSVYFSPRWKSILGYADDEIRNDFQEWECRLHPEDRDRALAVVKAYLDGESGDYELEHRLQHKDGSYRWIFARGAAVRDESGRPYRMVGSHLDITNRKQAETKLQAQKAQLLAAEEIQSYLLPQSSPVIPGFDIAGHCYPAEFAAGDHFDFLFMKNGDFLAVIGDVCGHGVGPAILMAYLHAYFRSLAQMFDDLSELVQQTNAFLLHQSPEERFVTLQAVRIDPATRVLSFVRCGHPPAIVLDPQGEVSSLTEPGTLPLGILPTLPVPVSGPIQLDPGHIVVLLTDGMLEAASPEGCQFGLQNVIQTILENRGKSAKEIVLAIREAALVHAATEAPVDDITLVVIKVATS